jgi:hypothetical protein
VTPPADAEITPPGSTDARDRCGGCGFEYDLDEAPHAAAAIVSGCEEIAAILLDPGNDVRTRREPDTWSALEYACHVRDVLLVQRERVLEARRTDRPSFSTMGREERVGHDGYAEQEPEAVARQLVDAAQLFANVLHRLGPDEWERTVVYSYPVEAERSLRWVAVHTAHEVQHHLQDVRAQAS